MQNEPRACKEAYAPQAYAMHPKNLKMRGRNRHFIPFLGLARVFSPHPVRNVHYKY